MHIEVTKMSVVVFCLKFITETNNFLNIHDVTVYIRWCSVGVLFPSDVISGSVRYYLGKKRIYPSVRLVIVAFYKSRGSV